MANKGVYKWMKEHTIDDIEELSEKDDEVGKLAKKILEELQELTSEA